MVQPFAPVKFFGRWRAPLLVTAGLLLNWSGESLAQAPKAAPQPKAAPAAKAAEAAPPAEAVPPAEAPRPKQAGLEERYEDPQSKAILAMEFPPLFPNQRRIDPEADRKVAAMAEGSANADSAYLLNYVQYQMAQLTAKANLVAMLDASANPQGAVAIETAGANLLNPLLLAETRDNTPFRATYTRALVSVGNDALKNNLYARTLWMVALSRSKDTQAFRYFRQVLDDPQQPLTLKLLAAVGVTEAADGGRVAVDPGEAVQLGRSLAGFLERESGAFWPARYRVVEALGSLRQASTDLNDPKVMLSAALLGVLSNPNERPQVRAKAAWALGMLRPSERNSGYNFALIAHHMGLAAADIGDIVVAEGTANPIRANRMTDLLLVVLSGLEGDPEIRNAGLLRADHGNLASQRAAVQAVADQVKALASAAVTLSGSAGAQRAPRTAEVTAAVQALRAHLAKSPPSDLALFPDGPKFPVGPAARENAPAAASSATAPAPR